MQNEATSTQVSVVIKKFKPGYSLSDHINRKNLIQTATYKENKGSVAKFSDKSILV